MRIEERCSCGAACTFEARTENNSSIRLDALNAADRWRELHAPCRERPAARPMDDEVEAPWRNSNLAGEGIASEHRSATGGLSAHDGNADAPSPVEGLVPDDIEWVCDRVGLWIGLYAENKGRTPTRVDVDHSSLLRRLLSGKDALPDPPPTVHSYPAYPEDAPVEASTTGKETDDG